MTGARARGLLSGARGRVDAAIAWRAQVAVGERIDGLAGEVAHLRERLDVAAGEAAWALNELARIAPQLASLEERVERAGEGGPIAPEAVEAVAEHERARARTALVSSYEERLRRVEEAVAG